MICKFGRCGIDVKRSEGIAVKGAGYDIKFCCWEHAALWSLAMASMIAPDAEKRAQLHRAMAIATEDRPIQWNEVGV